MTGAGGGKPDTIAAMAGALAGAGMGQTGFQNNGIVISTTNWIGYLAWAEALSLAKQQAASLLWHLCLFW